MVAVGSGLNGWLGTRCRCCLLDNGDDSCAIEFGARHELDVAHALARALEQAFRIIEFCTTPDLKVDVLLMVDDRAGVLLEVISQVAPFQAWNKIGTSLPNQCIEILNEGLMFWLNRFEKFCEYRHGNSPECLTLPLSGRQGDWGGEAEN